MKYSLCLTNYNRYEMLIESFAQVIDDPRIDDIVISDDASEVEVYNKLVDYFMVHKYGYKITMSRNEENVGMLRNKFKCLSYAKNEYCILFDSDNIISSSYLDAMDEMYLDEKTVFLPSWAQMDFDYRAFSGKTFDKKNIHELLDYPMGECAINTCNFVINKKDLPFEENDTVKGADTSWINYVLLKNGYQLHFVKNMFYVHRQSSDSEWMKNAHYNMSKGYEIKQLILNLK